MQPRRMQPRMQQAAVTAEQPEVNAILNVTTTFPTDVDLQRSAEDWADTDANYQAAIAHLSSGGRNLQPTTDPEGVFGWTEQVVGQDGSRLRYNFIIQSFADPAGASQTDAGLFSVVVQGQDEKGLPITQRVDVIVEKPAGGGPVDLDQAQATAFIDGQVADAASFAGTFWQRFVGCLRRTCAQACLGALAACVGTWVLYLKCLVVACGGCVLRCSACAGCDCRFWCRWAAGCCRP